MNNDIVDKLYLNPVHEVNIHRRKLNPIRQKEINRASSEKHTLSSCKSVPDLFKGLNGTVIIQNWNTKKNIPKDMTEYINLPSLIDRNKILKLEKIDYKKLTDKSNEQMTLLDKIKLSTFSQRNDIIGEQLQAGGVIKKISIANRPIKSRQIQRSNSMMTYDRISDGMEDKKDALVPLPPQQESMISNTTQAVAKIPKIKLKKFKNLKIIQKRSEVIDFSTFKQHLFLKDNDFLYAKRVGGPVDFALCSYQEINKRLKFDFAKISNIHKNNNNIISKNVEYITISKNTIIHYQKGIPHLYSIGEWTNNYIKYKKLLNIPLFKNFKNAGLFGLWKRYYRKKKRIYYTEKLQKKSFYVDRNLLGGILEIRRLFKDMTTYDLFKLNLNSPVFLNRFTQIYLDGLKLNDKKLEQFRLKVKKLLSYACSQSYKQFKKAKNITLEDPYEEQADLEMERKKNSQLYPKDEKEQEEDKDKDNADKKNKKALEIKKQKDDKSNLKAFLKDAIPYAQDATRKRHFKKLLKFIRLIDFLFNDTKFELIINSLRILDKRFKRLYDSFVNNWVDSPLITTMVVNLRDKISYAPSIELISDSIFEHFIQGNISAVIKVKNFIDPQEFPQYMVCFEEVFDVSVDQNGSLSGRIREDDDYLDLNNSIKSSFDKCRNALDDAAQDLTPSLVNYNKFTKINFNKVEEEANHTELNDYILSFKSEDDKVKKLSKKINIGIFEFHLEDFLNQIIGTPISCLTKIYAIIPKIMVRKVKELTEEIDNSYNKINIIVAPGDVEAFIKLKKAVDGCTVKRNQIEDEMDEIRELNNIINNYKEIKVEDFDKRKYDHLINIRTKYERFLDSMIYFVDQNIKQYRSELMVKIKKYDEMLNKIHDELNEEQINSYNEDTLGPLLFLEDKSLLISKAVENKKVFQQQEIDIEMDEQDRSNFENLDLVTYEYELKKNIWKNLQEYQESTLKWEKMQVMEIKVDEMEEKIKRWKNLCIVSTKDLDNSQVAKEFLDKVLIYEKVSHILSIIQNNNIQKVDYLKELLKSALSLGSIDFNDNNFLLEKILNIPGIYDNLPTLDEINRRANEENRIKILYKENLDKFIGHHIPFKLKVDEKGTSKYIIKFEDFDIEQEFIESLLSVLNKEMLNPYVAVKQMELTKLINNIYKYQYFLEVFLDYQIYMLKIDSLLGNTEFSKEFPSEYKKLMGESLTKSLVKLLKDSMNLGKYIDYAHERCISNLKTLINNYEVNYKAIHLYLLRRRKECQEYYLLNDDDLIALIELKDSYEIREYLLKKVFPFIKTINPGKDNDENIVMTTKYYDEKLTIKYTKTSRTFKDGIECIQLGITKKMKDFLKSFKKTFDGAFKPKSQIKPKELILDLFNNKDVFYQIIFVCFYHIIYYFLEKTLEKESEAFDKLFDFYNECKDEWKPKYIKMLTNNKENNPIKIRFIIAIITIIDYMIKSIESLLRDDVFKNTDYSYTKVLQIKIEVDSVTIKLFNYNFEYGNEYVGLFNDFFSLPQTEKTFLSILNAFSIHKSFVLYNNQKYFKKETLSMVSNILGRNIFYYTANSQFSVEGLNNLLYGNMNSGQIVCINNIEIIQFDFLRLIVDRISEVMRLLHCKQEEGYFNDLDGEKYIINNKKFNIFLSYNIDNLNNFDMIIPYSLKNNFRAIGINNIDLNYYLKLVIDTYAISRNDEINKKILFIIQSLEYKGNLLNKNHLKEKIIPLFYDHIKNSFIKRRSEINKKTIYDIVKSFLSEILYPFIESNKELKEEIDTLFKIILFDYEEKERIAKNLKNLKPDKNNIQKNLKINEEKKNIEEEKQNEDDKIYDEILAKFSFGNSLYKEKLKSLYYSLKNANSFILLGPSLSGKSNAISSLREISVKLNEKDNDKYPILNYIKIYPNSKDYKELFIDNNIKVGYQVNNIFFKNMIQFFDNRQGMDELQYQYKKMSCARGEFLAKYEFDDGKKQVESEKDKEDISNNNTQDMKTNENKEEKKENENGEEKKEEEKNNEENKENEEKKEEEKNNEEKKENEEEKKEEENKEEKEKKEEEIVNENIKEKTEENENKFKEKKQEEIKEETNDENKSDELLYQRNQYKSIIFDGSISPLWYNYLVNLFDPNNYFTLKDVDYIDVSSKKFIYETYNISNVSPSFIMNQKIISFDRESFDWLNISYVYVEKNYKTSKNEELKNYIKGLFENYGPNIIDFIEINKLKCISYCINSSFIIKNLINIFDAFLPDFDFTDIKIGRRNLDYIPRIDVIKRQTLCIFIFSSSWVMNLLTNFLIRNKIEKTVGDLFKSDDLKGPIFDYYLEENNYTFCLWSQLLAENKYSLPTYPKNTIFYYNHFFINTIENLGYHYIINRLITEDIPLLVLGKPCTGKTTLIDHCLYELESDLNEVKKIKINITHKINTKEIEQNINNHLDKISRKVFGDKYLRKSVVFIDDLHVNEKSCQLNEYLRYLLNTKTCYDPKYNIIKYYKDFNIIVSGNYCNTALSMMNDIDNYRENSSQYEYKNKINDYIRFINTFSIISLNLPITNFVSLYKSTFEFHLRNYIPNTSNITANQYISVLFKLNELLLQEISPTYNNLHYSFSIRDVTRIIQRFNMFLFRGTNEFPEYLKKIFLYETYALYTNKINNDSDIEIFKNNLVQAYNLSFKQDKLDNKIFDEIDKDDKYIYFKDFVDVYEENKENKYINPKDMEYVYINEKKSIKDFIKTKIKNYYTDYYYNGGAKGSEEANYIVNEYNNNMIEYIIRILGLLNNEYPHLIVIGNDYCGKELLVKIALFIMRYNLIEANINLLINKGRTAFENDSIIKTLQEAAYNNRKLFLFFPQQLFENAKDNDKIYLLEVISNLFEPDQIMNKFESFMNTNNTEYGSITLTKAEIKERLQKNLHIITTISASSYVYNKLFIDYPMINRNSNIIFIKEYEEENLCKISNIVFDKNDCLISNNLTKILLDIFNYVKLLYTEYGRKININLSINQRHYLNLCEYISKNYKKFKDILLKNKENYEKINYNIKRSSEAIKEKENEIEKLSPQKENNEKLIEESRKLISEKNVEKNKIKVKRNDEEKPMIAAKELRGKKVAQLEDALKHIKDSIKKSSNNLSKLSDKDLVDCKNTWENFPFGKFLLSKIFEIINDQNYEDFDYIKKNISTKHFKRLTNIDYSKPKQQYKEIVKSIVSNPDFAPNDKFNKPYKLAGLICEYFNRINKYNKIYEENIELVDEIAELEKQIEGHQNLLNKYLGDYKAIETEIINIESQISNYEINKANSQMQIDKIKSLNNAYSLFIQLTSEREEIYKQKTEYNLNLLNNFDYYMVYIASYISFAPILNHHYRLKLKNFILQNINTILEEINLKEKLKEEEQGKEEKENEEQKDEEEKKENVLEMKDIEFSELMFNFLDVNGADKELFTNSGIYNEFLKENFIFLHICKNRIPFILDYTQSAKEIIREYLEFDRMPSFQTINYNNNSDPTNEYKERLENSLRLGSNLFVDNIIEVNKIYYQFNQFINQRFSTNNSKKYVYIDEYKYEVHDNFKLFFFKNIFGNKVMNIDTNIWFSMIFINFNLSKEEIKNRLFLDLSKSRNELAYNGFKKFRNEKIKQSLIKIDTEKKIINTILQFDLSGNIDKLVNTEALNEKYKSECILYSNCEKMIEILDNKIRKQKTGLNDNYNKLCIDSSKIFKWLYKFCFFHTSYLIQRSSLTKYLMDYIQEKISLIDELKNYNEYQKNVEEEDELFEKSRYKRANETKNNNDNENNSEHTSEEEDENEEEGDAPNNNENNENNDENNAHEKVNPVIKELFIYNNTKDAKSLLIYLYNKLNSLFNDSELKKSLLLVFAFINVNLENKIPIPVKQCFINCHLYDNNFDECFDESEIESSPIKNINNKQWSILKKLNANSGQLFQDIFDNINENKEKWNKYLEDSLTDLNNNYFLNNLVFPEEELDKLVSPLIKFLFFYLIKPHKREFLIQIFLKNTIMNTSSDPQIEDILFIEKNYSKDFYSHVLKTKMDDLDITKAFKNFNVYKEHALVLIAPSNNMNIYDKILYEYCYLKMFSVNNNINSSGMGESKLDKSVMGADKSIISNNKGMNENMVNTKENKEQNSTQNNLSINQQQQKQPQEQGITYISEIKYKEIVLDNNVDLTQQDFEYIKNFMKIGGVIIIKNAQLLGHLFNELIKEMLQMKPDETSSNFKLVLICNLDEIMKNKNLYEQCRIINDNLIQENDFDDENKNTFKPVKEHILSLISKIPIHIYTFLLNSHLHYLRFYLRKVIYSYIILFGVLEATELKNPFTFGRKDFYALCKFILTYIEGENFTEEKYKNDFSNAESTTGFNFMTLITVINNIFIYTRQIDRNDECKVNKLVADIFNFKIFMSPEFYLDIGNIKINIKQNHSDLNFEELYKSFDHFFSEEYENLIPNQSIEELKEKSEKYSENIFTNIIRLVDHNYGKENLNKNPKNIDYTKLHIMLTKFRDIIPRNIQYLHKEDVIDLENKENEINTSLFKKNKYGLYFNSFDESLLYEIINFNEKLNSMHGELDLLIGMLEGNFTYDDYHLKVFEILGRGKVPKELNIFYEMKYFNKNIRFSLYKDVLENRISIYKKWLSDGSMKYYHLPIFTNIELFMNSIKMHFCRKYYGENDYAKITPDMISLKFVSTKFSTYEELLSSEKDYNYYNSVYHNEIIWADGLVLNNATIDPTNKHLLFSNLQNNIKQKLNIVGITYIVQHNENDDFSENYDEEVDNNEENKEENKEQQEEEEKEEEKEEEEEDKSEESSENKSGEKKEDKKEENEEKKGENHQDNNTEDFKNENQSVKIYIYGNNNDLMSNKYYKQEPIGFFEFRMFNSDLNGQNYIFEHDIKVTVEDYDDFVKNKNN